MALEYIKVFYDWEEATENLSFEERGRLIVAMLQYAKGKDVLDLSGNEKFLFPMCRNLIDRAHHHYEVVVETNRKNGVLGGRPKKTEKTQSVFEKPKETEITQSVFEKPNKTEKSQDKDKDKEKENEKEKYKYKDKDKTKTSNGSFDTDDLFEAALRRSYGDDFYLVENKI